MDYRYLLAVAIALTENLEILVHDSFEGWKALGRKRTADMMHGGVEINLKGENIYTNALYMLYEREG